MCTRTLSPSIITGRCMLQFWLKVVLRCRYGESSRPPFFTYTLIDDEENLRLKFELDTETLFSYLFSLLLSWIEIAVIASECLQSTWSSRAGCCHLLTQNGCFTGERVVTALHVDMDTRIRSRPCQIKQTSLWHLQGQRPGGIFF